MEHGEAARTEERKKEIKEKDGIREVRRGPEGLTIKTQSFMEPIVLSEEKGSRLRTNCGPRTQKTEAGGEKCSSSGRRAE